jgi:hypothetical protein
MKADVARVIHNIQNQLASIEMAGEILDTPDLDEEDRVLLEGLRHKAVADLLRLVRNQKTNAA